ncbi:hypothetical protein BSLG_007538 [Batrachochytrium salamandrivorans]|nr:hypothetical protein BSLG_007538 [Batrachochytrium salamandrivorans]
MTTLEDKAIWDKAAQDSDDFASVGEDILRASTDEIANRTKLLENDIKIMKSEQLRLHHEQKAINEKIKDNHEKIKLNKQLPIWCQMLWRSVTCLLQPWHSVFWVLSVCCAPPASFTAYQALQYLTQAGSSNYNCAQLEWTALSGLIMLYSGQYILDMNPDEEPEEDGANIDLDAHRKEMCRSKDVNTTDSATLKPGDLVGVNKDSYLILDTLPAEYDARVKAMEVDEKPTEDYNDVGGLDKQIEEMVEAIVLPMTQHDRFVNLGIKPPKGKTLLARACAAQTNACFLKLAGPQLVQMFIGDGAKLVRDAFNLAKEKAPSIIFIDEIDAIGTKRFDSEKSGDREVQRTMLELLNQLDGFSSDDRIKVIAATNRIDILDPALLRSGRLDRKIEFPHPNEEARARIMQIHSRKMTVSADVNFDELARSCDEFNGAQCKAICVEAGMIALRRGAIEIQHEDFMEGIQEVQAKKKTTLQYYA